MVNDLLGCDDPSVAGHPLVASVTYVSALSLWALVSEHWSAWQAARMEVRQEQEVLERQQDDVPGKVPRSLTRRPPNRLNDNVGGRRHPPPAREVAAPQPVPQGPRGIQKGLQGFGSRGRRIRIDRRVSLVGRETKAHQE